MFIVEKLISMVAPHSCMVCGTEGSVVCDWCLPELADPLPERCFGCRQSSTNCKVCTSCRKRSGLNYVWVRAQYDGSVKQLIHEFKFQRKQAAAAPIARMMSESLPYLGEDTVITHIPTATSRVRTRGYDHAELLAKELSRQLGLQYRTLLIRVSQTRQVGSSRERRQKQMKSAFRARGSQDLFGKPVLLVDDLTTTGATLSSAAECLRSDLGVKKINAAVFAQK